jgi:hypothetical protein
MSESLSERLDALVSDLDLRRPEAARLAFLKALTPMQRRLISVASIGFHSSGEDLKAIAQRVWGDEPTDEDLSPLFSSPLIEAETDGWVVAASVANVVSEQFRESEPEQFVAVHRAFVELETRRRDEVTTEYDGWFVDSRIAYFLAGVDPGASVAAFDQRFAAPPDLDRVAARMWLTGLVLKQSALLEDYQRDLTFYRGFRAYIAGARGDAREAFQVVADDPRDDHITAIAEHLLSVLLRGVDLEEAIAYCQTSVRLSKALDFPLNEVMATNTLVWMQLRQNQHGSEPHRRHGVAKLARTNLDLAKNLEDPVLVDRCRNTLVAARWADVLESYRVIDEPRLIREAEVLLAELEDLIQTAEPEVGLFSASKAGEIRYWIGDYDAAIDTIADALSGRTAFLPALASNTMLDVARNVEQHYLASDSARRKARNVKDTLTGLRHRMRKRREQSEDRELALN